MLTLTRHSSWESYGLSLKMYSAYAASQFAQGKTPVSASYIVSAHNAVAEYLDQHPEEVPAYEASEPGYGYFDLVDKLEKEGIISTQN